MKHLKLRERLRSQSWNKQIHKSDIALVTILTLVSASIIHAGTLEAAPAKVLPNEWGAYGFGEYDYTIFKRHSTNHAVASFNGGANFSSDDASTVIQNALNELSDGGKILIKQGTYTLTSVIMVTSNTAIYGEGQGITILNHNNPTGSEIFRINPYQTDIELAHFTTVDSRPDSETNAFRAITSPGRSVRIWIHNIHFKHKRLSGSMHEIILFDKDYYPNEDIIIENCIFENIKTDSIKNSLAGIRVSGFNIHVRESKFVNINNDLAPVVFTPVGDPLGGYHTRGLYYYNNYKIHTAPAVDGEGPDFPGVWGLQVFGNIIAVTVENMNSDASLGGIGVGSTQKSRDIDIHDNIVIRHGPFAFGAHSVENLRVHDNTMYQPGQAGGTALFHGIYFNPPDVGEGYKDISICNNQIISSKHYGIYAYAASLPDHTEIKDNVIVNAGRGGMDLSFAGEYAQIIGNVVHNASLEKPNTWTAVVLRDCVKSKIYNNIFVDDQGNPSGQLLELGLSDYNEYYNNRFEGSATSWLVSFVGANNDYHKNVGYVTANSGIATVQKGDTEVTVVHGCDYTPSLEDIYVSPIETLSNASFWWVDSPTETTFKIKVNTNPGQDVNFTWSVRKG